MRGVREGGMAYPRIGREAGMVLQTNGQGTHDGSETPGNREVEDTTDGVSRHDSGGRSREGLDKVTRVHLVMLALWHHADAGEKNIQ